MTFQEIVDEFHQLSLDDQLALLEVLTRTMRQSLKNRESWLAHGLLKTDQPTPSDEEVKRAYTDYIDEKYR